MARLKTKYQQDVVPAMMKEFGYQSVMQAPKLKKIWRGALVDEFFAADRKSARYWCLQADPAPGK